ncbi:MAG TPA: hypothetical protein VFS42_00555 [Burkholderiaceae bacterium]|nr:hypothetical protein [Burkholderiaceae bacterium]
MTPSSPVGLRSTPSISDASIREGSESDGDVENPPHETATDEATQASKPTFMESWQATMAGILSGGVPAAIHSVISSAVGNAVMNAAHVTHTDVHDETHKAAISSGALLGADMMLGCITSVLSHTVLDKHLYGESTSKDEILKRKYIVATVLSGIGGMVRDVLIAGPLGNALTHQPVTGDSIRQDATTQGVGAIVTGAGLTVAGMGAAAVAYGIRKKWQARQQAQNADAPSPSPSAPHDEEAPPPSPADSER